tara:strand:+ start:312 stop:722 length:411 start_codon:yes stop_codon:yes gene_type:complete
MDLDDSFDVKHGITIRGMEYGFVGISNDEIDKRVDDMIKFVEKYDGSVGGQFGEEMEACIDFPYDALTLEKFTKFEKEFRQKYPTFDGHLYLHDLNHFTAEESKVLDKFSNMDYDLLDELEDDYDDMDEGDEWKNK